MIVLERDDIRIIRQRPAWPAQWCQFCGDTWYIYETISFFSLSLVVFDRLWLVMYMQRAPRGGRLENPPGPVCILDPTCDMKSDSVIISAERRQLWICRVNSYAKRKPTQIMNGTCSSHTSEPTQIMNGTCSSHTREPTQIMNGICSSHTREPTQIMNGTCSSHTSLFNVCWTLASCTVCWCDLTVYVPHSN